MFEQRQQIFLTHEEVVEFTGYSQRKKQMSHLVSIGMPFEVAAGGRPIVSRAAVLERLSWIKRRSTSPRSEPDFSSI